MIEINNVEVLGWEHSIRGMRNPLNSWERSDSDYETYYDEVGLEAEVFNIGEHDLDLMKRLAAAGTDHAKYRRMITVYADILAPLYWWKEYDTYKVGTVANSCSTMHKIQDKEFTLDDFSNDQMDYVTTCMLKDVISVLNKNRELFNNAKNKQNWWNMIQLLPSSYNQKRTVMLNYEVLANMYRSRRSHKLDEWRKFCEWVETLQCSELITGGN